MIKLYYHGGSGNHGCEAIVRSTVKIIDADLQLFSFAPNEDYRYHLNNLVDIIEDYESTIKEHSLKRFICALDYKRTGTDYLYVKNAHEMFLKQVSKGDVYLSIGGDNYCYSGVDKLGYYNEMIHRKGAKTVLWGCSIEPSALSDSVIRDLKRYDLITVRESLTYEGLKQAGIIDNVILCSDPAFQLDKATVSLPNGFEPQNTVGINISPLAQECGNLVVENYRELLNYILRKTTYNVLLIPHVVKPESDDRIPLKDLYDQVAESNRVAMIQDYGCCELKGIIAQCKLFIGARTHATIAAYSTCVPTLVAGYSIKARGIAKDIFGTDENFVIPVQSMDKKNELVDAFCWLEAHQMQVKRHLKTVMPAYCQNALIAGEKVKRLVIDS